MKMEMIKVEEWEEMESLGNEEKRKKIIKVLEGLREYRISMKEISKRSKIKWVYSEVLRLVKENKVERFKKGKKYYYRIK